MMRVEDLLSPSSGLRALGSQPEMDPLTEGDALQEAQLLDVRFDALKGARMRSAFLVSADPAVFEKFRAFLIRAGANESDTHDVVQLRDERGNLLSVFSDFPEEANWEWQQGPFTVMGSATPPEMQTATACYVECRWEDMFAMIVNRLAAELDQPAWVLDSDGVLWLAGEVDPRRVRL